MSTIHSDSDLSIASSSKGEVCLSRTNIDNAVGFGATFFFVANR
jgi:hypothetical protein